MCIGALVAERIHGVWRVEAIGAPHIGERSEPELIISFVEKIAAHRPQLVTFNGTSFDLPVLRYRAMMHRISAPGLDCRPYFRRYAEDCVDLCDVLSSFDSRSKMSLNDLSRTLGFPGKPGAMDGSQVEKYVHNGRIAEVAAYCEIDVVNTYRIWLVYELFRGTLSHQQYHRSELDLEEFICARLASKPHWSHLARDTSGLKPVVLDQETAARTGEQMAEIARLLRDAEIHNE